MKFLRIVGKAAVAFYDELFFHFLGGLIHLVSWLLIIPGPFALAGIYAIGQRAVRGKGVNWRLLWDNVKEFGLRSLLLFLISIFGLALVAANLYFYNTPEISPFPPGVAAWTTPLFILVGVIWLAVVFYAQSFLMELEEPKLKLVYRNSLFLAILKPFQTLGFLVVAALATGISVALPVLVVVLPGFLSTLSLTAVRTLITELNEQMQRIAEPDEGDGDDAQGHVVDEDDEGWPSIDPA